MEKQCNRPINNQKNTRKWEKKNIKNLRKIENGNITYVDHLLHNSVLCNGLDIINDKDFQGLYLSEAYESEI